MRKTQNRRLCQTQPGLSDEQLHSPLSTVKAYHQRTKHGLEGYAAGPASLDWDAQPSPYRSYEGCTSIDLPLSESNEYSAATGEPAPINLTTIGQLFEYALSLSATKIFGADSWTVRCNPSSGNLHPTEAYLICGAVEGIEHGVYHYQSKKHLLEQRAKFTSPIIDGQAYIAISSVHWREVWKYGERAYRYCQLDVGHAIAAIRYSAALLGWQITIEENISDQQLASLCGINREDDFKGVEEESPDLLLRIDTSNTFTENVYESILNGITWYGLPNLLDPRPLYEWPIIKQIESACRKQQSDDAAIKNAVHLPISNDITPQLIKQRRSALAFQPEKLMGKADFFEILKALLTEQQFPVEIFGNTPRLHPVLFIHRVEGIPAGLYALPRSEHAKTTMQQAMHEQFLWQRCEQQLPLYLLQEGDCRQLSKHISCHQAIASDSAFSLGMLAEYSATLSSDDQAWRYRQLYWEAGMLGQVLYLQAEAHGYRGTGIGCFLDDQFHQLLGLVDQQFQDLYHFTVGTAVVDERITTLSPYSHRSES